ncbi:hypothetical protein GCM10010349_26090 [Streptomyces flavofungini]|nr:hypothetical protein GCM10010349_26090 [Streptomyces flavofungini]
MVPGLGSVVVVPVLRLSGARFGARSVVAAAGSVMPAASATAAAAATAAAYAPRGRDGLPAPRPPVVPSV